MAEARLRVTKPHTMRVSRRRRAAVILVGVLDGFEVAIGIPFSLVATGSSPSSKCWSYLVSEAMVAKEPKGWGREAIRVVIVGTERSRRDRPKTAERKQLRGPMIGLQKCMQGAVVTLRFSVLAAANAAKAQIGRCKRRGGEDPNGGLQRLGRFV